MIFAVKFLRDYGKHIFGLAVVMIAAFVTTWVKGSVVARQENEAHEEADEIRNRVADGLPDRKLRALSERGYRD